jgi:hypothetical protein
MSIFVTGAAPFFATYVFPAIVSVALSGVAMALVGVGILVLRGALHS